MHSQALRKIGIYEIGVMTMENSLLSPFLQKTRSSTIVAKTLFPVGDISQKFHNAPLIPFQRQKKLARIFNLKKGIHIDIEHGLEWKFNIPM